MIYHTGFHPLVFFTGNRDHDKSAVTAFYFTKIHQKVGLCEGNYCTGVGSGGWGGGKGGACAPHFFDWGGGAMVCLCPPPPF